MESLGTSWTLTTASNCTCYGVKIKALYCNSDPNLSTKRLHSWQRAFLRSYPSSKWPPWAPPWTGWEAEEFVADGCGWFDNPLLPLFCIGLDAIIDWTSIDFTIHLDGFAKKEANKVGPTFMCSWEQGMLLLPNEALLLENRVHTTHGMHSPNREWIHLDKDCGTVLFLLLPTQSRGSWDKIQKSCNLFHWILLWLSLHASRPQPRRLIVVTKSSSSSSWYVMSSWEKGHPWSVFSSTRILHPNNSPKAQSSPSTVLVWPIALLSSFEDVFRGALLDEDRGSRRPLFLLTTWNQIPPPCSPCKEHIPPPSSLLFLLSFFIPDPFAWAKILDGDYTKNLQSTSSMLRDQTNQGIVGGPPVAELAVGCPRYHAGLVPPFEVGLAWPWPSSRRPSIMLQRNEGRRGSLPSSLSFRIVCSPSHWYLSLALKLFHFRVATAGPPDSGRSSNKHLIMRLTFRGFSIT